MAMDSYARSVLQPGEQIVYQARVHWIIYLRPAFILVATLLIVGQLGGSYGVLASVLNIMAILGLVAGGGGLLLAWLRQQSDELVITNYRVIAKLGFVQRNTFELRFERVEGVRVSQSVLGRFLDYGTVIVNGTGGFITPIHEIGAPLQFRNHLSQVLNARAGARPSDHGQGPGGQPPRAPDRWSGRPPPNRPGRWA